MRQYILTATILLLTLSLHVSAQSGKAVETLRGLRDFGLIVKYERADGLAEVMQPTVLQMLQDRARNMLVNAGVPILPSTDEAEMAGKLRLVFTIDLKKPTDRGHAIRIQSKLYERVRLSRDPTREMELATLVLGRVDDTAATTPRLFATLEQTVEDFIRFYRTMNSDAQQIQIRPDNPPAQLNDNSNVLQGLNAFDATLSTPFLRFQGQRRGGVEKEFQTEEERHEFNQKLDIALEKKFKEAGIPWRRYSQDTRKFGRPYLYVSITLGEDKFTGIAIDGRIHLSERVIPVRRPTIDFPVATWEARANEGAPISDEAVIRVLNTLMDEFIKAYKKANPTVSTQPSLSTKGTNGF